ncbi:hypothetical protein [Sandarakinorhabdus sp.]|uniref:hypothetical protein n=1 Tax=Sandarakinorhabdus sp. TaxID=1916663 RepID=UPI00286E6544|nr:hypothetical protein [Sandarakinorhabdus sp.]
MRNENDAASSTRSIRATIDELTRYLDGKDISRTGANRSELNEKLAEFALWWFQEGFAVAHKICLDKLDQGKDIGEIELKDVGAWLAPGKLKSVHLQSPVDGRPDSTWDI